ncbi:ficolin-1-like [Crassostrea angulata]|uniref:ficolin-1-like n=1 Tax=Magallana angulata TaxID=2784310 RepID=UPI0022B1873C|nr:ficolin-1-like [Crassostrea angulata]
MPCTALSQCVGFDIIESISKTCRLLRGFTALIASHTASEAVRYEKFTEISIGTDSYCSVKLANGQRISTLCNQGNHQWMLIQRRIDGSENFWRNWMEYENGFGSHDSEFWLGNQNIHELTNDGYTYLRIEMVDQDCVWKYAEYSTFYVESDSFKYRLNVTGYSGDAGDSMWKHDGMYFTTYDNDNDNWGGGGNCATTYHGAWWYNACHWANLNGEYGNTKFGEGVNWNSWNGVFYSMKEVRMMVRKS